MTHLDPAVTQTQPWDGLRKLRNELAHVRLPDIDEATVWRLTTLRPARLRERLHDMWR